MNRKGWTKKADGFHVRVLWASRHEPDARMVADIVRDLDVACRERDREYDAATDDFIGVAAVEIVPVNMTFPARGREAAEAIREEANRRNCGAIAGVFPAHVAVALAGQNVRVFMPVSVPAPAVDGEIRGGGFVYSHVEYTGMWYV